MPTKSQLLLPPKELASCIAAGIFRDTRGIELSDHDRFNYFPASPLVSVTYTIAGELELVTDAEHKTALAKLSYLPPQTEPVVSWSAGPVAAITLGFYPDAWVKLTGQHDGYSIPEYLSAALLAFNPDLDPAENWQLFYETLIPIWKQKRAVGELSSWVGSDRLTDYTRYVLGRAATADVGKSVRSLQRRIKNWTGQTEQSLNFYATIEDLHERTIKSPNAPLAVLASDAGFADQSHMTRAVRRATGFSPAKLNHLIETEEAFWCYRLLGERF